MCLYISAERAASLGLASTFYMSANECAYTKNTDVNVQTALRFVPVMDTPH